MRVGTHVLFAGLLACSIASEGPARTTEQLLAYLECSEFGRPIRSDGYTYGILMADSSTPRELIGLLTGNDARMDRRAKVNALNALASIGAVDKSNLPFEEVAKLVAFFESQYDPANVETCDILEHTYWVVAQYGTHEALQFLVGRIEDPTWFGGAMPQEIQMSSSGDSWPASPRSSALKSLLFHPRPEAITYIDSLSGRTDLLQDAAMSYTIQYATRWRGMPEFEGIRQKQQAAWALKQRGFRLNEEGYFVPLDEAAPAVAGAESPAATDSGPSTPRSDAAPTNANGSSPRQSGPRGWVWWAAASAVVLLIAAGAGTWMLRRH